MAFDYQRDFTHLVLTCVFSCTRVFSPSLFAAIKRVANVFLQTNFIAAGRKDILVCRFQCFFFTQDELFSEGYVITFPASISIRFASGFVFSQRVFLFPSQTFLWFVTQSFLPNGESLRLISYKNLTSGWLSEYSIFKFTNLFSFAQMLSRFSSHKMFCDSSLQEPTYRLLLPVIATIRDKNRWESIQRNRFWNLASFSERERKMFQYF